MAKIVLNRNNSDRHIKLELFYGKIKGVFPMYTCKYQRYVCNKYNMIV